MKGQAYAKINLHLKVFPRREDGYHDIESIFQKISLCDELTINITNKNIVSIKSEKFELPVENTISRAIKLFKKETGLDFGCEVILEKKIPSGAGLGGGSSDAALTLNMLNEHFNFPLDDNKLFDIAAEIGSDVPFFMKEGSAIVTGRGEKIERMKSRTDLYFVLIYPNVSSSTKQAYESLDFFYNFEKKSEKGIDSNMSFALKSAYYQSVLDWNFANSFTFVMKRSYSEIEDALCDVRNTGSLFSEMTGSGSVVFGTFLSEQDAEMAYYELSKKWDMCYIVSSL